MRWQAYGLEEFPNLLLLAEGSRDLDAEGLEIAELRLG